MRFKLFLQLIIFSTTLILFLCYLLVSQKMIFNYESLIYLTLLSCAMIFTIEVGNKLCFPLLLVLIIYVLQEYSLSGFVTIFLTGGSCDYYAIKTLSEYTSNEYNVFLRYALFGYCVVSSGLIIGVSKLPIAVRKYGIKNLLCDSMSKKLSTSVVIIYVVTLAFIILYSQYILGESYVGIRPEGEGGWWRIFYNMNIPVIIILSLLFFNWVNINQKDKNKLFFALFIIFIISVQSGSRSFLYTIFINYIIIFMVLKNGNFRIKINIKMMKMAVIIFIGSLIFYPIATIFRYKGLFISRNLSITEIIVSSFNYSYGSSINLVYDTAIQILMRLSSSDASLKIMNDKNLIPLDNLLSIPHIVGRVINNLVPGDIFSDLIYPQYLFDHIFYNRFVGWNATDWGLWEECYLIFGYWTGLFVLFLGMIMVGYMWRLLLLSRNPYKLFYISTFIYFFFQRLLVNYEISLVISSVLVHLIVFQIIIKLLFLLSALFPLKIINSIRTSKKQLVQT